MQFFDKLGRLYGKVAAALPPQLRGLAGGSLVFYCLLIAGAVLILELALAGYRTTAVFTTIFVCAMLLARFFWFRQHIIKSLLELGEAARHIAAGSYGTLAPKYSEDEVGALTDAVNDMSAQIAEANRTQSEFISSISHELRTPLTAISGWSETLLYDESISGDSRRGIEIILRESGHLTNMVEQLLEFNRMRDGRFTLSIEATDIAAEIEDIVYTYGELMRQENVQLVYSPSEEELPLVSCDPHRLKQVVLNILDNAEKYGGGSDVELSVGREGDFALVTVRDHGPGISEADLPHVKERFYKGSTKQRGSGIGLSVCDEIISRHGGQLLIENAEGGGALVRFTIPFAPQQQAAGTANQK